MKKEVGKKGNKGEESKKWKIHITFITTSSSPSHKEFSCELFYVTLSVSFFLVVDENGSLVSCYAGVNKSLSQRCLLGCVRQFLFKDSNRFDVSKWRWIKSWESFEIKISVKLHKSQIFNWIKLLWMEQTIKSV